MSENNLISIIIPCYNAEESIGNCLKSILSQTYDNNEIIIIDDGSTDNSKLIVEKYKSQYPNIRYCYQSNSGPSSARNHGIRLARGQYIMFVDADDFMNGDYIQKLASPTINGCDLVIGGYSIYTKEKITPKYSKNFETTRDEYYRRYYYLSLKNKTIFGPYNKLYRTELIKKYNLKFNENISIREDGFFVLDVIQKSSNIAGVENAGYYYVQNPPSTSLITKYNYDEPEVNALFLEKMMIPVHLCDEQDTIQAHIYKEFLDMEMSAIAKFCISKDKKMETAYQYGTRAIKNKTFIEVRNKLIKLDFLGALKYYQPLWFIIMRCQY